MSESQEEARKYFLDAIHDFGLYIAGFEASAEKASEITEFAPTVKILFTFNYVSHSPFAYQTKVNKKNLRTEEEINESAERLYRLLKDSLTSAFLDDENFDLSILSEKKALFMSNGRNTVLPSDAEIVVELLALQKATSREKLQDMCQRFDQSMINVAEKNSAETIIKDFVDQLARHHKDLKAAKQTPEFIAERNRLAMVFPSLVKQFGLEPKAPKPVKEASPQADAPVATAAANPIVKPIALGVNAGTVVRSFETKFAGLIDRLGSKPADKRFNEQSCDDNWKSYRAKADAINAMIASCKKSHVPASTADLAVLTDFFAHNFLKELGDKKQFFVHGVLALAVKDLAQKGVETPDELVAKAVNSFGLDGAVSKMKEKSFNAADFIAKIDSLPSVSGSGITRECGVALLRACATGDEKAIAGIKQNLDLAAAANSIQARQTALENVRNLARGERARDAA